MSWFMVGLFNGLLPCGLVYAGLALSLTSGNIALSAAMMFAFGLGTIPAMTLVPVVLKSASPKARGWVLKAAALLLIIMGAFTMIRGSAMMHGMMHMQHMEGMGQEHMMMDHDMGNMPQMHDMKMRDMDMNGMDMKNMDMQDMNMENP